MSTTKADTGICETLLSQESILGTSERNLISDLLARARSSGRPGEASLPESIARLAGEIVAERVSSTLGKDIERLLLIPGRAAAEPRVAAREIFAGTGPGSPPPTPGKAPHPPGPNPPGAISAQLVAASAGSPPVTPGKAPHPPGPNPPGAISAQLVAASAGSPPVTPAKAPHPPGPNPPGAISAQLVADSAASEARELPEIQPAPCVIFEEFLTPAELHSLTQEVLQREMQFQISEVISPGATGGAVDFEYRRSRVLLELGKHQSIILNRIQSCSHRVFEKLGVEPFWPARAEIQVTASNHGDFFRCHSDNGHQDIQSRALTFVYFFHREPKQFRGGELRLYDSRIQDGAHVPAETHRAIVPRPNQIVFFPSSLEHEITPVDCPSQAFADSRFTVNGWLHH